MAIKNKIIITSGYFIWLHKGHVELFEKARALGDKLIVILNNDKQQILKYNKIIIPESERSFIMNSLRNVDQCYLSLDDDKTVCKTLKRLHELYCVLDTEMIFAKGGDRFEGEIPEKKICDELQIKIVDGLGKKIQSSSLLLDLWNNIYN